MKTFSTIDKKDITEQSYTTYAELTWQFVSSSNGMEITYPTESIGGLDGSVVINRATSNENEDYVNIDTGTRGYILYRSLKHLFYNPTRNTFISASSLVTESIVGLPDNSFVVSIGQNLYGDSIKPGSFLLTVSSSLPSIQDDLYGNLFYTQSGVTTYVGNIFYNKGIAVIKQNTSSLNTTVTSNGIQLVSGSNVELTYKSNVEFKRYQFNIRVGANDFNFSPFNPTVKYLYSTTGSITSSFVSGNIQPKTENSWSIYNLMGAEVIKPYMTTIGLYNDQYELLAVAKLATPIQRTFETEQIFIVRFDTE